MKVAAKSRQEEKTPLPEQRIIKRFTFVVHLRKDARVIEWAGLEIR